MVSYPYRVKEMDRFVNFSKYNECIYILEINIDTIGRKVDKSRRNFLIFPSRKKNSPFEKLQLALERFGGFVFVPIARTYFPSGPYPFLHCDIKIEKYPYSRRKRKDVAVLFLDYVVEGNHVHETVGFLASSSSRSTY